MTDRYAVITETLRIARPLASDGPEVFHRGGVYKIDEHEPETDTHLAIIFLQEKYFISKSHILIADLYTNRLDPRQITHLSEVITLDQSRWHEVSEPDGITIKRNRSYMIDGYVFNLGKYSDDYYWLIAKPLYHDIEGQI